MRMLKYAAFPLFALLASCAAQETRVESTLILGKQPTYESKELKQSIDGKSDKPKDELYKQAAELAKEFEKKPLPEEPYVSRTIDVDVSEKSYKMTLRDESGWMPQKYIDMLDNAILKDEIVSYKPYMAGISYDGKEVKKPLIVARKTDGTYCFFTYNAKTDDEKIGLPVINVYMHDPNMLSRSIKASSGAVRTDWPSPKTTGEIRKNCPVKIKTNKEEKEIIAPYVIDNKTVILDKELNEYLKKSKILPKIREVLSE